MAILLPDRIDTTTFGEFLRDARERRGITLQQIARQTRIPFRHLDALEHGQLDAVPSGMYRRAEIRAYADAVGLDRGLALAQLEHALESSPRIEASARSSAPSARDRWRAAWTALGAIGVVAAATMFAVSLWHDRSAPSRAAAPEIGVVRTSPPDTPIQVRDPEPWPNLEVPAMQPLVAPQPVAQAQVFTAMAVTSDPNGARVVVDGIGRGVTPLTVQNLTGGVRRVRVIKDGFVSQERDVRISAGREPAALHVTLAPVR